VVLEATGGGRVRAARSLLGARLDPAPHHHPRHSALGHQPPVARLNQGTNLVGPYT